MVLHQILKTPSESSVFCIGAQQHKFRVVDRKKASFHFINLYQCEKCGEKVRRQYKKVEEGGLRLVSY